MYLSYTLHFSYQNAYKKKMQVFSQGPLSCSESGLRAQSSSDYVCVVYIFSLNLYLQSVSTDILHNPTCYDMASMV